MSEIDALLESKRKLISLLNQALQALESGGMPPEQLEDALAEFRQGFAEVRDQAIRRVAELQLSAEIPQGMEGLAALLERIAAEAASAQAHQIAQRVLGLAHANRHDFPPLAKAREAAEELLQNPHSPVRAWLAALIGLVTEPDADDDTVGTRFRQVEAVDLTLALAAVRRELVEGSLAAREKPESGQAGPGSGQHPDAGVEEAAEAVSGYEPLEEAPSDFREPVPAPEGEREPRPRTEDREIRVATADTVVRLLAHGQGGLAYLIARAAEAEFGPGELPSDLVAAAVLGTELLSAYGPLAQELRRRLAALGDLQLDHSPWGRARSLLLLGATARAALIDPHSGAGGLLSRFHLGHGLRELAEALTSYGERLQGVEAGTLAGLQGEVHWREELAGVLEAAQDFWKKASSRSTPYAPATQIWQHWLHRDQMVERILRPVLSNDVEALPELERALEKLSQEAIHLQIDRDHETLHSKKAKRIEASAREVLLRLAGEALELARNWARLQRQRPQRLGYLHEQIAQLHRKLQEAFRQLKEVPPFELPGGTALWDWLRGGLLQTLALFDAPPGAGERAPAQILHAPLLRLDGVELDERWEPHGGFAGLLPRLRELAGQEPDWERLFEHCLDQHDLQRAERIIDILPVQLGEALRTRLEEQVRLHHGHLVEQLRAARNHLELALMTGLLNADERAGLDAKLASVEADFLPPTRLEGRDLRFYLAHARLAEVTGFLDRRRVERVKEALGRLEREVATDHPAYGRIRKVLEDSGDVLTANEYLERVRRGEDLPEQAEQRDVFRQFLASFKGIYEYLNEHRERSVVNAVRQRAAIGALDLRQVPGRHAEQAARMLEAWFELKSGLRRFDRERLRTVLEGLGFTVIELAEETRRLDRSWVHLTCHTVRDREDCPIPFFGSLAGGRYRILLAWGTPSEDGLLSEVNESSHQEPVLVFYFGQFTEKRRRDLARLSRTQTQRRRRSFLVLDDVLMVFLCGERGRRLPALFHCTLPYTVAEPYVTTAGKLPPEMFYGRHHERQAILRPKGPNFLYGGRQLGKTALLRSIEDEEHRPALGRLVRYIDLANADTDRVWELLHQELVGLGVVKDGRRGIKPERLLGELRKWLQEDASRSLLLLLDEADAFLEYDNKSQYAAVTRLKQLMEETDQRFRFVLAGLHNVVRTARDPNHPLGHFGDPIRIGPMIEGSEWQEARELIERPLRALGYRLQEHQVFRILGLTNYYPSLLQLFGQHLLKKLLERANSFREGPPYEVPDPVVDETYQSPELQDAVRRRFSLTLNLDPRYELVANLIAFNLLEGKSSLVEGLDAQFLFDEARGYWSEGFRQTSLESFVNLLEEMQDLGVLRRVNGRRFTLRSQNLLYLMGTQDEIMARLVEERMPRQPFEPSEYRGWLETETGAFPSPLTALQEQAIERAEGPVVVVGSRALGLELLEQALRRPAGWQVHTSRVTSPTEFAQELDRVAQSRSEGTTVLYVPPGLPWGEPWLERARERLRAMRSKERLLRVVFAADPRTAWQLEEHWPALMERDLVLLGLQALRDTTVNAWLEKIGAALSKREREELQRVTGNSLLLLLRYQQLAVGDPRAGLEALDAWIRDNPSAVREALGLGTEPGDLIDQICQLGPVTREDLEALFEGLPGERVLRWGERLGLLEHSGDAWEAVDFLHRVPA
jgi:hypothetical protein